MGKNYVRMVEGGGGGGGDDGEEMSPKSGQVFE